MVDKIIFRNDDVSPSSDFDSIKSIYQTIKENIESPVEIWSCINIFSKKNTIGSVYPDLPLKNLPLHYFYNIDSVIDMSKVFKISNGFLNKITSHGILHIDHSKISKNAQEFSIISSCKFLETNIFVPPFSQYNQDTEKICSDNNIKLVKSLDGWKSFESEPFNPTHKLWFFHSWRFTPESFSEKLKNDIATYSKDNL